MATNIKRPTFNMLFKGLGVSAVERGERGSTVLIVVDATEGVNAIKYETISDFTSDEQAKFTADNVKAIIDALEGIPRELFVYKLATSGNLNDLLAKIGGEIPRNCWIGIQSETAEHHSTLATWVKGQVTNNKKRYKGLVYKVTNADSMHVVNFTNAKVVFPPEDERGEVTGDKGIAYLLGYLAGLPLTMSANAKDLKFKSVTEPVDVDVTIGNGEFVLVNDEGKVKVARGVNSLVTLGQNVIEDMCFINTVEKMDLIYCDIYKVWNEQYKGKYPNFLNNQILFISAINGYLESLANDLILDPTFDNRALIDLDKQRIANYPKYGEEVVKKWSDDKIKEMVVGNKMFLKTNIKITGIFEDLFMDVFM